MLLPRVFHNFPMRFGGLRMFLLLDQVDPVFHFANSASVLLEEILFHAYSFLVTNRR